MSGRRRARRERASEPEAIADALEPVIERLGGALLPDEALGTALADVIGEELADRTEITYREPELRVIASNHSDATTLRYKRAQLARWATAAMKLDREPGVAILVARERASQPAHMHKGRHTGRLY